MVNRFKENYDHYNRLKDLMGLQTEDAKVTKSNLNEQTSAVGANAPTLETYPQSYVDSAFVVPDELESVDMSLNAEKFDLYVKILKTSPYWGRFLGGIQGVTDDEKVRVLKELFNKTSFGKNSKIRQMNVGGAGSTSQGFDVNVFYPESLPVNANDAQDVVGATTEGGRPVLLTFFKQRAPENTQNFQLVAQLNQANALNGYMQGTSSEDGTIRNLRKQLFSTLPATQSRVVLGKQNGINIFTENSPVLNANGIEQITVALDNIIKFIDSANGKAFVKRVIVEASSSTIRNTGAYGGKSFVELSTDRANAILKALMENPNSRPGLFDGIDAVVPNVNGSNGDGTSGPLHPYRYTTPDVLNKIKQAGTNKQAVLQLLQQASPMNPAAPEANQAKPKVGQAPLFDSAYIQVVAGNESYFLSKDLVPISEQEATALRQQVYTPNQYASIQVEFGAIPNSQPDQQKNNVGVASKIMFSRTNRQFGMELMTPPTFTRQMVDTSGTGDYPDMPSQAGTGQ